MKRFGPSTALIAAFTFLAGSIASALFEKSIYDQKARLFAGPVAAPVALVEIDQESIDFYSRQFNISWPWPRSLYARAVDYLAGAGARAIALDMVFSEPGLYGGEDEWLAASVKRAGNVFMPFFFLDQEGAGAVSGRFALAQPPPLDVVPAREGKVTMPLPEITAVLRGGGNAAASPDSDHVFRRLCHFVRHGGHVFPSFSLAVARFADPTLSPEEVPFAADGGMNLKFYRKGGFARYGIAQVIQSQVRREAGEEAVVPAAAFRDRVVVIGATALALLDNRATPVDPLGAGFELHATALANFLERDFIRAVPRAWQWLLVLLAVALLNALLPGMATIQRQLLLALAAMLLATSGNALLFHAGLDLDLLPLLVGMAACSGSDAYLRYQRMHREKKFIEGAFKGYMSDSLLAEILKNPRGLNLGGERKRVTVFFSDLAGFTTISEQLPPEEVVKLLNRYLERMNAVIMENGGYIDKYEGDAIMALWGAPLDCADQATRALRAALRCQEELQALNAELAAAGLPRLGLRIGINSGEVIVGNIGSRQRFAYTVIGDAVNLASRLEGVNKQYGTKIVCGSLAARMASGELLLRRLDRVRVKGKQQPEEIFEVVGEREGTPGERLEILERFARGLRLYFAGGFSAATDIFHALAGDPPSQVFDRRCRYLQEHPPADWDGVWTHTEK
ncbi:MAG: adenylate/guanylate cyclase domain-containing protein [Candidatus Aminicenantes bacterium]|nr:adenylate/guanylate cyclase domain-containing protein [Candidatus Aminicenantes bacterium]